MQMQTSGLHRISAKVLVTLIATCSLTCTGTIDSIPSEPDLPADETVDEIEQMCVVRRQEAYDKNRTSFTRDFVRWACADTETITGAKRGQEYCEYFAVVKPPPSGRSKSAPAQILGNVIARPVERVTGEEDVKPQLRHTKYTTTPVHLEIDGSQQAKLQANPTEVVGECVFTSWNQDSEKPLACEEAGSCPDVFGVPMSQGTFRMSFEVNSLEAAIYLIEDCFYGGLSLEAADALLAEREATLADDEEGETEEDEAETDESEESEARTAESAAESEDDDTEEDSDEVFEIPDLADPFMRGCYLNAVFNETPERKSDSVLCASSMRVANCGCRAKEGKQLVELFSPEERRGFLLGSWKSPTGLPDGCRALDVGDAEQTMVACELTAQDVLLHAKDVKHACREKYAQDVVVHVPVPHKDVVCSDELVNPDFSAGCGETPWTVSPLPSDR